jgi:hypothetical protein
MIFVGNFNLTAKVGPRAATGVTSGVLPIPKQFDLFAQGGTGRRIYARAIDVETGHYPKLGIKDLFFYRRWPHAPVCRPHLNPFVGFGGDPSTDNATTGKRNSLRPVFFNDGYFEIADVGRRRYGLPLHIKLSTVSRPVL